MHTITTLTSDDQWIWPVSPRPGAMELLLQRLGYKINVIPMKTNTERSWVLGVTTSNDFHMPLALHNDMSATPLNQSVMHN